MPPPAVLVAGTVAFDTVAAVDALPGPNEATRVGRRRERGGGAGANVARTLATLGLEAPLLTAHGPDFPGTGYEADLLEAGVDLEPAVEAEDPTARAWLFTDDHGDQQIYYDPGATPAMGRCRVPGGSWEGWGHFAPGAIDAYPALMEDVERVSFDPGQEVFHRDLDEVARCLPHVDLLFLNEHERELLERELGRGPGDLLDEGVEAVVETVGARGARVHVDGDVEEIPAVDAEAVDPTGAGDAHRAGTLAALAHGRPVAAAARFGATVASFAVEASGPQEGLPSLEEALERHEEAWGEPPW